MWSAGAALDTPGAVDYDVREALEALIRTYRTLESGVYYESVPANPLAANIYRTRAERGGRISETRAAAAGNVTHARRGCLRAAGIPAARRIRPEQRPAARPRIPGFAARILCGSGRARRASSSSLILP